MNSLIINFVGRRFLFVVSLSSKDGGGGEEEPKRRYFISFFLCLLIASLVHSCILLIDGKHQPVQTYSIFTK